MRLTRTLAVLAVLTFPVVAVTGCRPAPPNLTPAGVAAFKGTQAIKGLDLLRDFAIDAHETIPPLLSEDTTRRVVLYHKSAITVIHEAPNGWVPIVTTGLAELEKAIAETERVHLVPYITLARTLITEVAK